MQSWYFSDYRILVHGAAGDSGQNEAERTNSATMDTVVDDSKINCEYHERFDELTREEILSLNLIRGIRKWRKNECETRSKSSQRSIQADWWCSSTLQNHQESSFWETWEWIIFKSRPIEKIFIIKQWTKKKRSGASYIKKHVDFRDSHYQQRELYMEYLKGDCSKRSSNGLQCAKCRFSEWISLKMSCIPRTVPHPTRLLEFYC